jgi:hypothetical protein
MKNLKNCGMKNHVWNHRFELVGIILIILATCLTMVSFYGPGIVMLFLVGLGLCWKQCLSGLMCHCCCHTDHDECSPDHCDKVAAPSEPVKTTKTAKPAKKE